MAKAGSTILVAKKGVRDKCNIYNYLETIKFFHRLKLCPQFKANEKITPLDISIISDKF